MFAVKMAHDDRGWTAKSYFPQIPNKAALIRQTLHSQDEEAPYRALIGVVVDGRDPPKYRGHSKLRTRNMTGQTNRWRSHDSLYGDLLGTNQALKAVNLPFKQTLVKSLTQSYPSINPMFSACRDFTNMNKSNWSVLKTMNTTNFIKEEEDDDFLPSI